MNNLNLIFNKLYYDHLGMDDFDEFVEQKNKEIFTSEFKNETDFCKSEIANTTFLAKTTYPGLLIGHGSHHGSGRSEGDISSGMDFDFVTGQPYISGSTVKGVLRTCIRYKQDAALEIIKTVTGKTLDKEKLAALEKEIFDGNDVFLDAVIYDGDDYGRVVDKDYFSPHRSEVKNPLPLLIIKVLPDVRLEFRFILSDGMLSKDEKEKVFQEIILLFGIGARTNVGYGKLIACDDVIGKKEVPTEMLPKSKRQEMIICPKCGAKNLKYKYDYKYRYTTTLVNPNWEKGICFKPDCGGELK